MKVLGITDERTDCECCGKTGLKCTVALECESGGVVYFGRDCAANAIYGRKTQANVKKVEAAAGAAKRDAEQKRNDKLARIAVDKNYANYLYKTTRRPLENSYFAFRGAEVVRIDGNDFADVSFYASEGFAA